MSHEAQIRVPIGMASVRHADDTVHLVDMSDWPDTVPLWRLPPLCGEGTGVSSDENAHHELHHQVTCIWCISLVAV